MRVSFVLSLLLVVGLCNGFFSFLNSRIKGSWKLGMSLLDEPMELCEENAELVIQEVRDELGTIFGYDKGSREVGITGEIELVEIDGPTVIVALNGRFWHATDTVMMRVSSYVMQRIPEVIDVVLSIEDSTIQDDNRLNTGRLY
jgi:hypothetical protein